MPQVQQGNVITDSAQVAPNTIQTTDIVDAAITGPKIAMGSDARGDILVRGATAYERLAKGAANTVLKHDNTDPSWATVSSLLDAIVGSDQGTLAYRNATVWAPLAPGTSGQFLKTLGAAANPVWADVAATYASGAATKNLADASTTQNIAHGLGATPSLVLIIATFGSNSGLTSAYGIIRAGTGVSASNSFMGGNGGQTLAEFDLNTSNATNVSQNAVLTSDATNIILTWTKEGSPTGTANLVWFAIK